MVSYGPKKPLMDLIKISYGPKYASDRPDNVSYGPDNVSYGPDSVSYGPDNGLIWT